MNVLIIGSGAREHALALAVRRSASLSELFVAPGNPGCSAVATLVSVDPADHAGVVEFCRAKSIGLVIVGPEAPLVSGLTDSLERAGVLCFGPSKAAARLEGSKAFTKELCAEMGIPTAAFRRFDREEPALVYVREKGAPIVVKADGLAGGKGVVVAGAVEAAEEAIRDCFGGRFGSAGSEVVVEDFLRGREASFFALCDGERAIPFGSAQDHKRVGDGDTGPNTGGMGAFSPTPLIDSRMTTRIMNEIVQPTIDGMRARGTPFRGALFAGLMIGEDGPKLIEFNVRFGDPEAQVLFARLRSDPLDLMHACASGRLRAVAPEFDRECAVGVVLATKGYPGDTSRGSIIRSLDRAETLEGVHVLHGATAMRGDDLVANGGRVLTVVGKGTSVALARRRAYDAIDLIDWPEGFCRRDIASTF